MSNRVVLIAAVLILSACNPPPPSQPGEPGWVRAQVGATQAPGSLTDVAVSDDYFMAGGYSRDGVILLRSGDGIRWADESDRIEGNGPETSLVGIAYGGTAAVALLGEDIASDQRVSIRLNRGGPAWRRVIAPQLEAMTGVIPVDVEATRGGFVAIASRGSGGDDPSFETVVLESPDGERWSQARSPELTLDLARRPEDVTSMDGEVIILADRGNGGQGTLLVRDDDGSWTAIQPAPLQGGRAMTIEFTSFGLIVGGCVTDGVSSTQPAVWVSAAGADGPFEQILIDSATGCVLGLAEGAGIVRAVGVVGDRAAVWSSMDGDAWQLDEPVEAFDGADGTMAAAAASTNTKWVAVGFERDSGKDTIALWRR